MNANPRVYSLELATPIPGSRTPGESIARARQFDAAFRAESGFQAALHKVVILVSYDDARLLLYLDDGMCIEIGVADQKVHVTTSTLATSAPAKPDNLPDDVLIQFGTSRPFPWNRHEMCRSITGKHIDKGFFDGRDFYLYLSTGLLFHFTAMQRCSPPEPVLYWGPSD